MRLCFIVEERYRADGMPMAVVEQLMAWGHDVDVLEPQSSATCLSEFTRGDGGGYDAVVLKTVSDGPGLSLLEAAAALGVAAINDPGAIRMVRDKAVAAAVAQAHGLPFPRTWFITDLRLLEQIPAEDYPLVVKPSNGSAAARCTCCTAPSTFRRCAPPPTARTASTWHSSTWPTPGTTSSCTTPAGRSTPRCGARRCTPTSR
jgi:ribosomal protein S6--L-glutamate ligase